MVSEAPNAENVKTEKDNAGSVGALLKASRLRLGDDLRFVAETLHIRFIYLEAIENSQYDKLPGAAYAIGFIRTYADYLGLDSEEVVRRYKVESETKSVNTDLVFPVPIPESSIPAGAIVFVGVIIALIAYGGWYVSTAKDGFLAGLVTPVPERLAEGTPVAEPEMVPEPEAAMGNSPASEPGETIEEAVEETAQMAESASEAVESAGEEVLQATEESSQVAEKIEQTAAEEGGASTAENSQQVAGTTEKVEETIAPVAVDSAVTEATSAAELVTETAEQMQESVQEAQETVEEAVQSSATDTQETAPATAEEPSAIETPEPAPEPVQNTASAVEEAASSVGEGETETNASSTVGTVTETAGTAEVTASATAAESGTARVYGAEQTSSRILVKARKNSWIQVRDNAANRLVMTRLLRAGDSYRVPDQEGLVLLTGNAGALEIFVDGEKAPDLGGAGAVRRNVALDPDLLRQGTATQ